MSQYKRKLIEVALPLEAINRESVRENYIYRGNPSAVHKWWAQRPLAACRAVLFAQLVDDPSAHPDKFPTEEDQARERKRLFGLIERLVVWENSSDEALLRQVFSNLLANAVKYSRKTPVARIEIGTQPAGPGEAIVFVRDNGAGFDMKYVDKLFGVFQRLHTDADFEGTGVGLATVRRIVQCHGGRVWAEGKPNVGATFFVALPTPPDLS